MKGAMNVLSRILFESETFREYFFSRVDIVLGVKEISHPRCSIYSFVKKKKNVSKSFRHP